MFEISRNVSNEYADSLFKYIEIGPVILSTTNFWISSTSFLLKLFLLWRLNVNSKEDFKIKSAKFLTLMGGMLGVTGCVKLSLLSTIFSFELKSSKGRVQHFFACGFSKLSFENSCFFSDVF